MIGLTTIAILLNDILEELRDLSAFIKEQKMKEDPEEIYNNYIRAIEKERSPE